LLRKNARVDPKKIVYLGHSQGALAAPRAGKLDPELAGLIIMAAPTRPLEDVGLSQFEYIATIPGTNGEGAKQMLPLMREATKLVKSPTLTAKTPTNKLPLGIPAPFWLDVRGYKPEVVAAGLKMPALVLQGEADYQVTMVDFAGWKKGLEGKSNATTKSYPGLLHSFTDCGCKLATPDDYAKPGNVAVGVIDDVEKWMKAL
jgi:pimeloyl-ACP methyl ester carboxylesterase